MCGSSSPKPAPTPAPAPPPPTDGPSAPVINEKTSEQRMVASGRSGRGSLRINKTMTDTGSAGTGLTIPN
jgi:hypothetical protein